MPALEPLPSCKVSVRHLDPTLAELRVEFTGLPADVTASGRLMGPRCPGVSTIEVAYPLRPVGPGVYRVVIPEPVLWSAERRCVYEGPIDFVCAGEVVGRITVSCGLSQRGAGNASC